MELLRYSFDEYVPGKQPNPTVKDASDQLRYYLDNWLGLTILLIFLNFSETVDSVKTRT